MIYLLLNTIALEPNRWTRDKIAFFKLNQLMKPIADAGFHFLEVWQYHILREQKSDVEMIRKMGDSFEISFPIVGMYPQLHLDGQDCVHEKDKVKQVFDYARLLGAKIIKIFVGNRSGASLSEKEYNRSLEFMQDIVNEAKIYDLIITGETHQKTLFETIDSTLKFLNDVNADNFKVCFQPFDLQDTNRALIDYSTLSKHVNHVHYQGRKNKMFDLLENSELDYKKLTHALLTKDFKGYVCIEFVKDCVVENPSDFDLELILKNALQDKAFIVRILKNANCKILS